MKKRRASMPGAATDHLRTRRRPARSSWRAPCEHAARPPLRSDIPVESRRTASDAGRRGATRPGGIAPIPLRISCERAARLAVSPFSFNCLWRLRARSSALAVRKILSGGLGEYHGAHVPAVRHQARRRGKSALALQQRGAHRRHRGDPGGRRARRLGANGARSRPGRRAGSAPRPGRPSRTERRAPAPIAAWPGLVVGGEARAGCPPGRPAGTAHRCRAGASRGGRRPGAAMVPLPEPLGPSMAMTGTLLIGRRLRQRFARSSRPSRAAPAPTKPGNEVATLATSRISIGPARAGSRPRRTWRCGDRRGCRSLPPPNVAATLDAHAVRQHLVLARRAPRGPRAMTAMRSLSLTRSSSAPVTTVSPSAQAAAMNNTGNSSIASGTSRSGTAMPRSARRRAPRCPPPARAPHAR